MTTERASMPVAGTSNQPDAAMEKPTIPESGQPPAEASNPNNRPEWLSKKYKTVEDQAKAYVNLERLLGLPPEQRAQELQKMTAGEGAKPTPQPEGLEIAGKGGDKPADPNAAMEKTANQALQGTGIKVTDIQKEIDTNGSVSEQTYQKLQQAGIDKESFDSFVNQYRENLVLANEAKTGKIMQKAGLSMEEFGQVREWASQNMSEAELASYNQLAQSGNVDQIAFAISGMKAKYIEANGQEPQLVQGSKNAPSAGSYNSTHEMIRDMRDIRYQKDPAFREAVMRKVANSQKV